MKYSYEGIGHLAITLPMFNAVPGHVCKLTLSGDAAECDSGEKFIGVAEGLHKSMVAVQVEGFVTVPYSGTKPGFGYVKLAGNGEGGVAVNTNGREYLVVSVDAEEMTAVIKL